MSGYRGGGASSSVLLMSAGESKDERSKKRKRDHAVSEPGLQLSLRASHGGWHKSATSAPAGASPSPETLDLDKLKKGQQVSFLNRHSEQRMKIKPYTAGTQCKSIN